MNMCIPDIYQKSVFEVNYKKLFDRGIKCILFDINNTLVPTNSKEIDDNLISLFDNLKKIGINPILYADSSNKTVNIFKEKINIEGYSNVYFPFNKKMDEILKQYKESELAIVGDLMIPDIKYGNKIGITTILVNPISSKDSFKNIFRRRKEKHIMTRLRKNNLFVKGRYYE